MPLSSSLRGGIIDGRINIIIVAAAVFASVLFVKGWTTTTSTPCIRYKSSFLSDATATTTTKVLLTSSSSENHYYDNDDHFERDKKRHKRKRRKKTSISNEKKTKSTKNQLQEYSFPTVDGNDEIWRIYGVTIHPDSLEKDKQEKLLSVPSDYDTKTGKNHNNNKNSNRSDDEQLPKSLRRALKKRLNLDSVPPGTTCVRRSFDARKRLDHPVYNYVVDIPLQPSVRQSLNLKTRPGRIERLKTISSNGNSTNCISAKAAPVDEEERKLVNNTKELDSDGNRSGPHLREQKKKVVVVVGMGPAGLFCALQLALKSNNTIRPILLDRGQPVDRRGQDIGALIHRRKLNEESNFAFGEGGAGTWSDGKLTTRIGRNSETVRLVLETLVEFGAPSNILWKGAPHLGTDNLVKLLRKMRLRFKELGGEIFFDTKMTNLKMKDGKIIGVHTQTGNGTQHCYEGDEFVLATGHSARDVYESLNQANVKLEPKGFAVGFRVEHPQAVINKIQYGDEWGPCVKTGKGLTDNANEEYFGIKQSEHIARLPVASYRLATDKASDGVHGNLRGAYSFCMCPGGQIVLSSTKSDEICVNGMSFSRRDSKFANSALVVTINPNDDILIEYKNKHGVMAGLEFQREMERKSCMLGGGNLTVPVQRMTDFVNGEVSATVPPSSYRLGVKSAPCHDIYPEAITHALRDALTNHFEKQMPGYYHPDGLLHAVETRTSSPLRVARDRETYEAIGISNLYPCGEGAGFAGGIVSAAVDGVHVAEAILDNICGDKRPNRIKKSKSIGFSY